MRVVRVWDLRQEAEAGAGAGAGEGAGAGAGAAFEGGEVLVAASLEASDRDLRARLTTSRANFCLCFGASAGDGASCAGTAKTGTCSDGGGGFFDLVARAFGGCLTVAAVGFVDPVVARAFPRFEATVAGSGRSGWTGLWPRRYFNVATVEAVHSEGVVSAARTVSTSLQGSWFALPDMVTW